jgi:hypothetical protein
MSKFVILQYVSKTKFTLYARAYEKKSPDGKESSYYFKKGSLETDIKVSDIFGAKLQSAAPAAPSQGLEEAARGRGYPSTYDAIKTASDINKLVALIGEDIVRHAYDTKLDAQAVEALKAGR